MPSYSTPYAIEKLLLAGESLKVIERSPSRVHRLDRGKYEDKHYWRKAGLSSKFVVMRSNVERLENREGLSSKHLGDRLTIETIIVGTIRWDLQRIG
jgi:hypothetical protein